MTDIIEPRILKGFRDFLPASEIERKNLLEKIEASFRSFGFVPIDTPVLEYAEILLGKGGGETEKQVYRFNDHGGRDVALRFDLTVPFARFLAVHRHELNLPFKRYHIAKVWRGENTQRGRYREFTQCDFDIVGSDSSASDFEILLMMRNTLMALGAGDVTIKVNHRGLFNLFLKHIDTEEKSVEILRTVDKLAKIGADEIKKLLTEVLDADRAEKILDFIKPKESFEKTLESMTEAAGGMNPYTERMQLIRRFMNETGTSASFEIDPSITRGLDYYTGIVYETFLNALPEIGSVCSGGRYDNLAGLYSKEKLSGVGSSIGLDRLIAALESLGQIKTKSSYADLLIACVDETQAGNYQALAGKFREEGIPCEVFLEEKKLTQQFVLAEKKGASYIIIPGKEPLTDSLTLRIIASRENRGNLSIDDVIKAVREK